MTTSPRSAACPQCGRPAPQNSENPWRPFCSERCKLIDLGAWLDGRYHIPGSEPAGSDEGTDEPVRH